MSNESVSLHNSLKKIFDNKTVQEIFLKIDTDYARFSFQEKSSLMKAFNLILRRIFDTDLELYIDNGEENDTGRSVFLSIENNTLTIQPLSSVVVYLGE